MITDSDRSLVASFRQTDEAIRIILLAAFVLMMGSTAQAQETTASTTMTHALAGAGRPPPAAPR